VGIKPKRINCTVMRYIERFRSRFSKNLDGVHSRSRIHPHPAAWKGCGRAGLQSLCENSWIPAPRFRGDKLRGNDMVGGGFYVRRRHPRAGGDPQLVSPNTSCYSDSSGRRRPPHEPNPSWASPWECQRPKGASCGRGGRPTDTNELGM